MKNGPYILVVAPDDYPGMKYRGRYVYEHHLVWWRHTGQLVPKGSVLHHKDDQKTRNVIDNLELKSNGAHTAEHNVERAEKRGSHGTWAPGSRRCKCEDCRRVRADSQNKWRWKIGLRVRRVQAG